MNTMKNVFWGIALVVFGLIWGLNALDITRINIFLMGGGLYLLLFLVLLVYLMKKKKQEI